MAFTAGSKLRASDLNNLPYDTDLGGQARTTTSGNATTSEVIVVTTPTFTLLPNLWYSVELDLYFSSTVAADTGEIRIRDTNGSGTQRAAIITHPVVQNNGGPYFTRAVYLFNSGVSPSPTNWVGTLIRAGGTGTFNAFAGTRLKVVQNPSTASFTTV